jgi:hypothetical protein
MCVNNLPQLQTKNQFISKQNLLWYLNIRFFKYICFEVFMQNTQFHIEEGCHLIMTNIINQLSIQYYKCLERTKDDVNKFIDSAMAFTYGDEVDYCDSGDYEYLVDTRNSLLEAIEELKTNARRIGNDQIKEECDELEEEIDSIFTKATTHNNCLPEKGTMNYYYQVALDYRS